MPKTVLVTGGGRGLGRGVVRRLAHEGHHVVFTVRAETAGRAVTDEVLRESAGAQLEARSLNLGSFVSIRRFSSELPADLRFDVVLHCAGVMQQSAARRLSADGFEETLAVNALGPFLLTHELLARLKPGGRLVGVSSRLHLPDSRGAPVHFDFEDPNLERGYQPDRAYKNSKLALLWFTFELARRLPKERLTVHGVCPGFVPETAAASTHGAMRLMMRYLMPLMPFATGFDEAVDSLCFTCLDPALDATTGDFWAEKKPFEASPQARDPQQAARFFEWAQGVTGTGRWP